MKPHSLPVRSLLASAVGLCATAAFAVSPKYWIHDTAEEFLRGEPSGVSVMSDGTLRLAPDVNKIAERDEPYVWDLARDPRNGDVYLGTGDDGLVVRVRGNQSEDFFQAASLEVVSVAVGDDGRVYAGTAPEGLVYAITREGEGEILFDAEELYVWDLAMGPDGMLYAAVGPGGTVYRIDPKTGESKRFFETEDNHVVCLAFDSDGNLLVGTEGRGLVARIEPNGDSRVLYDFPQGEVGAVLPGPDGSVWAAAAATAESREETTQPDQNADGTGIDYIFEITPSTAGDGVLYRIDPEGNALRVWESGQGAIYDLAWDGDGHVLATTGDDGGIYEVDEAGRSTLLLATEESQVVAIKADDKDGFLYATANPSRLVRISSKYRDRGTLVSEVLDARHLAKWGRIEWTGEKGGGKLSLSVRAGNTDEPDGSWTDWSKKIDDAGSLAFLGKARYVQWRATLEGGGGNSPLVRRVRVSSLENNLAPLVVEVSVVPSGNRFYEDFPELRPRPLYQALPGGVKVQYSYELGGEQELPSEARAPWTHGLRQVSWEAVDPNEDFLIFDLSYRREDEERWKQFAESVEGQTYTFNAKGMPDGKYRILVSASDRRFNPNDERTTSRESEEFIVDNTAPGFRDVKHKHQDGEINISGTLSDDLSDLVRFEISVNGEDWMDRRPADGIFDSSREQFELKLEAAKDEEHSIILRGTDLAGNLGTTRVLIRP